MSFLHAFRLGLDESMPNTLNDFNELLEICKPGFCHDLPQDEKCFECCCSRSYNMPIGAYSKQRINLKVNNPTESDGGGTDRRLSFAAKTSTALLYGGFRSGAMVTDSLMGVLWREQTLGDWKTD